VCALEKKKSRREAPLDRANAADAATTGRPETQNPTPVY
jgi:hypothetical protein